MELRENIKRENKIFVESELLSLMFVIPEKCCCSNSTWNYI